MRSMTAAILLTVVSAPAPSAATPVERGEYLVGNVGMCSDCHTPRDAHGVLVQSALLHGAPVGFKPLHPMPFAVEAPRIAGMPDGYTPTSLARFLETGQKPDGSMARPPMPAFRLSPEDAASVVAYLRTLR